MEKAAVLKRDLLADAVALAFVLVVPALSHLTAMPFYLIDPMRIAALGVLLATRDWKTSLALAVLLPVFSMLVSGHPVFPKCLLISVELGANVLLLEWFTRLLGRLLAPRAGFSAGFSAGLATGIAAFASILVSKGLYYLLKLAVISFGWLQMDLVSTARWIQLVVALAISLIFALVAARLARSASQIR